MTSFNLERRKVLAAGGVTVLTALAGCSAFADGRGMPGTAEPIDDDEEADWLDPVGNWDGEAADFRGEEEVEVMNGEVEGTDQEYVYEPPEIYVDSGTEVTWVWSGDIGHSVTHRDGEFDSENISGDGETWSYVFEEDGVYEYYCRPHQALNQKGRVVVGEGVAMSYLSEVANFDEIVDFTGESDVNVQNGEPEGVGQAFAYEPAAIRVDAGTEVTWEWVGGATHTVTNERELFDSGEISGEGETWSYTFDEPGIYLYYCEPHRALNQLGAVVVE